MNRIIYLHELDSVRTQPSDVKRAEYAIFEEIIKNGNMVVLTMNQLTDSCVMAAAMRDENVYEHVMELFAKGAMKLSLYSNIRTASQYVQQAIEKCLADNKDSFIFSSLPVRSDDYEMLKMMKTVLQYSDISLVQEKLSEQEEALKMTENPEDLQSIQKKVEQLKVMERFLSLVLALSVNETCNIPKKKTPGQDFLSFMSKMKEIIRESSFANVEVNLHKEHALYKLEKIEEAFEAQNIPEVQRKNRTNWLKPLIRDDGSAALLAEEIVHLCYNYTVEDSILDVSKSYTTIEDASFAEDVVKKLDIFWTLYGQAEHDTDQDDLIEYPPLHAKHWAKTAEIAGYDSNSKVISGEVPRNEKAEKNSWRWVILKKTGMAAGYMETSW